MNYELKIKPEETLFFRDGKPMAAGESYGKGCNMPMPNILHSALRTALICENVIDLPDKKKISSHTKDRNKNRKIGVDKFGSLRVKVLLSYKEKIGVLYPIPRDVLKIDKDALSLTKLKKIYDKYFLVSTTPPSKDKISGFWKEDQFRAYLNQEEYDYSPVSVKELWKDEWRVGIEIDSNTNSVKEHKLYAGEYMRMDDSAAFAAEVILAKDQGNLKKIDYIHFGGEKRLAKIDVSNNLFPEWEDFMPDIDNIESEKEIIIKWILMTPSVFANGSIPGWIEQSTNNVKLQPKIDGQRVSINAQLIACSTGEPKPISGWDLIENTPKPTLFSVRPGAVYYFKCDTKNDAVNLIKALHARNRSDMFGEQGFGFGLCTFVY